MIHVRGSVFLKASDAGANLRPLGFAPRGAAAWRTLAGPMRLGAKKPGKDLVGKTWLEKTCLIGSQCPDGAVRALALSFAGPVI